MKSFIFIAAAYITGVLTAVPAGPVQNEFSRDVVLTFLAAGGLGLASYLVFLSLFLYWAKRFISGNTIKRINFAFGIALLTIAAYFLFSSAWHFLKT
ncbi:MAG: hypothetical protein C4538_07060 [Nitrospiraceae bacterium]|nr:MAG: hypothetical protein C4538_07060 [Nitrospiraceae bacterium]